MRGLPDLLASAPRASESSARAYETSWRSWIYYCVKADIDFRCPMDSQLASFAWTRAHELHTAKK